MTNGRNPVEAGDRSIAITALVGLVSIIAGTCIGAQFDTPETGSGFAVLGLISGGVFSYFAAPVVERMTR